VTSTLENMYTAAVLVIGRTLHKVRFAKSGEFARGEYGGTTTPRKVQVQNIEDANLVSSLLENGKHAPAIDLDFPIHAIPSTTPGHYHLYLERELEWKQYEKLLKVMAEIGLIEKGFYQSAMHFKQTYLRLPHIKKDTNAPTFK